MTRSLPSTRIRLVGLVLTAMATGMPTGVEARTMEEKLQAACRAAIHKLCPGTPSDEIKACMLRKRSLVDPACMKLIDGAE